MQPPDSTERDDHHQDVRENINRRRGNQKNVSVDTSCSWSFYFADTLEDHGEYQCYTVERIEPDHSPDGIEDLGFPGLTGHKNPKKQQ